MSDVTPENHDADRDKHEGKQAKLHNSIGHKIGVQQRRLKLHPGNLQNKNHTQPSKVS